MKKERPAVCLRSSGPDNDNQSRRIEIGGMEEDENERMGGVLRGHWWMTVRNGRMVFEPTTKPLPDPPADADIAPYWRGPGQVQLKLFDFDEKRKNADTEPSLIIQHLCGYDWSKEGYEKQAEKLKSYGFSCLRSQRGNDGRFWEIWYLPGLWSARGDLQRALANRADGNKKTDVAVRFLCQNCYFGTLDVCVQRAAAVIE